MKLNGYLSWLCLERGRLQRSLSGAIRSQLTRLVVVLSGALTLASALREPGRLVSNPMLFYNLPTCYSSLSALALLRRPRYWAVLRELEALVRELEDSPGSKEWSNDTKQKIKRFFSEVQLLGASFLAGVLTDVFSSHSAAVRVVPLWPLVPHAGALGAPLALAIFLIGLLGVTSIVIDYTIVALVCATLSAAGAHRALAARLDHLVQDHNATAPGEQLWPDAVREVVLRHQRLRELTLELTALFHTSLAPIMCSTFTCSMFATIQVLDRDVTGFTVSLMLPIVVIFLQLSFFSQDLMDSSLAVRRAALGAAQTALGRASFLRTSAVGADRKALAEARAGVLVALAATRLPALRCRGLGHLSLRGAAMVIRKFYSAVNVLGPRY